MDEKHPEEKRGSERLWNATRKTLGAAAFRAGQYKRIVQKKLELASLHKSISNTHGDLGKLIDDYRVEGEPNSLEREDIRALFEKLDDLKQRASALEDEIERIACENPPQEDMGQQDGSDR